MEGAATASAAPRDSSHTRVSVEKYAGAGSTLVAWTDQPSEATVTATMTANNSRLAV
jgi:hypothetical protein